LNKIIGDIYQITSDNAYSAEIKIQLETYVNLILEMFAETEK